MMRAACHYAPRRRQQGLTLVEIMIAITLGLVLTAGILQVFISSKQTYRVEESLSRLQESARFALEFLTTDIRMASYWGCQPDPANINNLLNTGTGYIDFTATPITGSEGASGAPDNLTLHGADGTAGLALQPNLGTGYNTSPAADLQVSAPNTLSVGTIVLVSDCLAGDIFQISGGAPGTSGLIAHAGGAGSPGNTTGNLTNAYQGDAMLFPMQQIVYTLAAGANGQSALWRSVNGVNQELVSDVTDLQILYGEDTNGDRSVDRYVSADAAGLDFANVYGIRIQLTVQTADTNTSMTTGTRISRDFSTTVSIRNRVL